VNEPEWLTRKKRIDPRLDAAGWKLARGCPSGSSWSTPGPPKGSAYRREEDPTDHGPADYTLCDGPMRLAVVEAKKAEAGVQEVMKQAERYARGASSNVFTFGKFHVPFAYTTNGEVVWFRDLRNPDNLQRQVRAFHTPDALRDLLVHDVAEKAEPLDDLPFTHPRLRDYQRDANRAVEKAIAGRSRRLLVEMATGTGKTFTMVHLVARLMKAGVVRRVLFLVDRRALAAQAVRAFQSFDIEPGLKFHKAFEVYSQKIAKEDLDDDASGGGSGSFDASLLPESKLTQPKSNDAFVYVCTVQRMAINVLGTSFDGVEGEAGDDDATKLDIPIHAFDLVIADECHRGYTAQQQSVWRDTLEHFDAVQVGLTATPATHTVGYFGHSVFTYGMPKAVADGHLVDYDVVKVASDVRVQGMFLKEGEQVDLFDFSKERKTPTVLEDERAFDAAAVAREQLVTSPDSNRKIALEVKKYADEHEQKTGRFPKILVFAAHDIPKISHADQLVQTFREVLGRGNDFVEKITGRVDRPLQAIKRFRNRTQPGVVVTVDLLSTGVDIPDLDFIVLLRIVRSRILFEQILGRGTRKGERFPDKSHFTVFDCFDGTLLGYFKNATGITAEEPAPPTRTIDEVVDDIWQNNDRDYNLGVLVKRLQRVDKSMAPEGRALFAAHGVEDGDLAAFAKALPKKLDDAFVPTMKLLRDAAFLDLVVNYPRPKRTFLVASGVVDNVTSEWLVRGSDGQEYKPDDYLSAFASYVKSHAADLAAIQILTGRPRDWSPQALKELRDALARANPRFTYENLETAFRLKHKKALVEILSMVQRSADEQHPLLTATERVAAAFDKLTGGRTFTPEQQQWLDRIRDHLVQNLSIDEDDFDLVPVFEQAGGLGKVRRVFGAQLPQLLQDINEALAAA
jgi:type I restriction enzyme R subunit